MNWMAKLEHKFGKYAIRNLTMILIGCYVTGYALEFMSGVLLQSGKITTSIMDYLTLNPYAIMHGQVWRIISWVLIPPPESNIFFAVIMLFFYFSIGRTLEYAWGDFQYNVYLFIGMFFTLLGSFLMMGVCYLIYYNWEVGTFVMLIDGSKTVVPEGELFQYLSGFFSTYYINMSIFLAYAATFPENKVLLAFIIPIKVKILGFMYAAYLVYEMVYMMIVLSSRHLSFVPIFTIGASLMNFLLFFLTSRKYIRMSKEQRQMHRAYAKASKQTKRKEEGYRTGKITRHQCAVCGRSEKDGEDLVFRFCSKCEGNYEYCQDHLYTHIHFTQGPIMK